MSKYTYGYIHIHPSEFKNWKQHKFAEDVALEPLPPSCDNAQFLPPVGNQLSKGCCTCFAICYYNLTHSIGKIMNWDTTAPNHIFSPDYIYNQIAILPLTPGGGSSYYDAVSLIQTMGCASLGTAPYNDKDSSGWPTEAAYIDALKYRIKDVTWIDTTADDTALYAIKSWLAKGNIAFTAVVVYANLEDSVKYNNIYCLADITPDMKPLGAHMLTVCSYDDTKVTNDGSGAFKCINSWGESFGEKGFFWISYRAMMQKRPLKIAYGFVGYFNTEAVPVKLAAKIKISYDKFRNLAFEIAKGDAKVPFYSDLGSWADSRQFPVDAPSTPFWVNCNALENGDILAPTNFTVTNATVGTSMPQTIMQFTTTSIAPSLEPVDIPTITHVQKNSLFSFKLLLTGTNFKSGSTLKIGTTAWSNFVVKSDSQIIVKGGSGLKALFPQYYNVLITITNPSGWSNTTLFKR